LSVGANEECTVTRRSIRLCGQEVDQPGHICAFFSSRDEEYETLIPYLKDGVDAGEQVLNVLDEARLRDHRARLESGGVPVGDGHLLLSSSEDTYVAGGLFDMDRMVGFVRDRLVAAAAEGRCVRTAGWMDWIYREAPGTERAMEYEARMNLLVPTFDCTFMCVYDLTKLHGEMVVDIMATHPYVVLRGRIRQNPFYIPPEVYLGELLRGRKASRGSTMP
jgi:MEDS: MEthanogen/methylotroph, DcmR Sensory domain